MLPRGCHLGDVAPDWKLTALCEAFLQGEMLSDTPGYAPMQQKLLRESGLEAETVETILALRGIMHEWKEYESKRRGSGKR